MTFLNTNAFRYRPEHDYDLVWSAGLFDYFKEKLVKRLINRYLILRTGWLFGGEKNYKKNFIYNRYLEAQNKNFIYSDTSQLGNPTYVENVVKQIHQSYKIFKL